LLLVILASALLGGPVRDWRLRQVYPYAYRELIETYARPHELDPLLVAAVIRAESNFWTWATSPQDARGLMQVLPSTGAWVASQLHIEPFDSVLLYQSEVNIALGCWYLAHLLRQYRGDLPVALAAWNAGPTRVSGWLGSGQWSGDREDLAMVPIAETRVFVGRVLDNLDWYRRLYGEAGP